MSYRDAVELLRYSIAIRVLFDQWLERLTYHQKVAGSIPNWCSGIIFSKDIMWTNVHMNVNNAIHVLNYRT